MENTGNIMKHKGKKLNILIVGAHPDDCEVKAGGFSALALKMGHNIKFVSLTNGDTGHYQEGGGSLARRRKNEAECSAKLIGAKLKILDIPSNTLFPDISLRRRVIELIREFKSDIVITHRPNDYHPDHRYTSQLILDSATNIKNPNVCPLTKELDRNPLYLYMWDKFQKPLPFSADFVFAIDSVAELKVEMLDNHVSQFYEWLPWEHHLSKEEIPKDKEGRKKWLKEWRFTADKSNAERYEKKLIEKYGFEKGSKTMYCEAFELAEYGRSTDKTLLENFKTI